jgi:hypothetical protein
MSVHRPVPERSGGDAASSGPCGRTRLAVELLRAYDRRGGMDECATLARRFLESAAPDRLSRARARGAREDAGSTRFNRSTRGARQCRGDSRGRGCLVAAAADGVAVPTPARSRSIASDPRAASRAQ